MSDDERDRGESESSLAAAAASATAAPQATAAATASATATGTANAESHASEEYGGEKYGGGAYYPFPSFGSSADQWSASPGLGPPPLHPPEGPPPLPPYSPDPPSPLNPRMRPYYPRPRPDEFHAAGPYPSTLPPGYAAPQAPLSPPLHPFPEGPHPTYYGSWQAYNQGVIDGQQLHYPHHPMLPPEAHDPRQLPLPLAKREGAYGALELNVFEVENEQLAIALDYVHRCPKATLFDIEGMIANVARADEAASHFILKRLRVGNSEERRLGLTAALSAFDDLVFDQYGGLVLQGLFEFGSSETKNQLMDAVYAQDVAALCLHGHGCRVIQKAIRCLGREEVCKLFTEFHDKVYTFNLDPNGNHVIQRGIQVMSFFAKSAANAGDPDLAAQLSDQMKFIVDDIAAHAEKLSTHRYGCRVVQRAIEHCIERQKEVVLESVVAHHRQLVTDQYGNYVVQQVLACGGAAHRAAVLETLTEEGALLSLSMHKYASNVVESVLLHGESQHKEKILEEMLRDTRDGVSGSCCLIELSKDPIANYVVNRAIEVSEGDQKDRMISLIAANRQELSKSPFAKYVLQRIVNCDKQKKVL